MNNSSSNSEEKRSSFRETAVSAALRSCRLFSHLPPADLAQIASFARAKSIDKDEYLFREGEAANGFFVVQQGSINVHRLAPNGKEQIIHIFRPGETLAEAALSSQTGYPADARATENSRVLFIPKTEILALIAKRPELALRMLGSMSEHLRTLVMLIDDLRLKSVETRVVEWLLQRCPTPLESTSVKIDLPHTKKMLAAELGTSAETLSRTLAAFARDGLISNAAKAIVVLDPSKLQKSLGIH